MGQTDHIASPISVELTTGNDGNETSGGKALISTGAKLHKTDIARACSQVGVTLSADKIRKARFPHP